MGNKFFFWQSGKQVVANKKFKQLILKVFNYKQKYFLIEFVNIITNCLNYLTLGCIMSVNPMNYSIQILTHYKYSLLYLKNL
jgi:hypothetical protein